MNKAFVLEQPRRNLDLTTINKFGKLHFIFEQDDVRSSVFTTDQFSQDVVQACQRQSFDPSRDYFCIVGSLVAVVTATVALLKTFGSLKVLFYHAAYEQYVGRVLRTGDRNETRSSGITSETSCSGDEKDLPNNV